MTRWIGVPFLLLTFGMLLNHAVAQETPKKGKLDIGAMFKKLDTNSDGKLSKDEFLKLAERFKDRDKARAKLATAFEKLDADKKGLSVDQFRQYVESVRKKDDSR